MIQTNKKINPIAHVSKQIIVKFSNLLHHLIQKATQKTSFQNKKFKINILNFLLQINKIKRFRST